MPNQQLSRSLFNTIKDLLTETNEEEFLEENMPEWEELAGPLREFFSITTPQAILLAIYLEGGFRERSVDIERVLNHFGKDISCLALVNSTLEELSQLRLLQTKSEDIFQRRSKVAFKKEYEVPYKVLKAVLDGSQDAMVVPAITTIDELIDEIQQLISRYKMGDIQNTALMQQLEDLTRQNGALPELEWLLSHNGMTPDFVALIFMMLIDYLDGDDDVNVDRMCRILKPEAHERLNFKRTILDPKGLLLAEGLVEYSNEELLNRNRLRLSDLTVQHLTDGGRGAETPSHFRPTLSQLIYPDKTIEETLFYNTEEEKPISILRQVLEKEMYQTIRSGLMSAGMKPGFTVLLYGYPGTGKTATVKQLARLTGRTILMVDIAQIQSKWVGESEKNLTKVFDEYRRCLKYYDSEPILLFNEADAILGKRFNVKSSVDKSFNSLQNILLQQLEDFEGIFVATTNLADHLDEAFDRRFLYKVQFNRPSIDVRRKIFRQAFPACKPSFVEELLKSFQLTGGQIMNIKKKLTITRLIEPGKKLQALLPQLIREEVSLSSPTLSTPIGFMKPATANYNHLI
jgi:hypothetical protein